MSSLYLPLMQTETWHSAFDTIYDDDHREHYTRMIGVCFKGDESDDKRIVASNVLKYAKKMGVVHDDYDVMHVTQDDMTGIIEITFSRFKTPTSSKITTNGVSAFADVDVYVTLQTRRTSLVSKYYELVYLFIAPPLKEWSGVNNKILHTEDIIANELLLKAKKDEYIAMTA